MVILETGTTETNHIYRMVGNDYFTIVHYITQSQFDYITKTSISDEEREFQKWQDIKNREIELNTLKSYWPIYKLIHSELAKRIVINKYFVKVYKFFTDNFGVKNFKKIK